MQKQKQRILTAGQLLNNDGTVIQKGYAYSLVKKYDRSKISASPWRIKQWDYYYFGDYKYGVALTIADLSYGALVSVSIMNYKDKIQCSKSHMKWLTFGSINLPNTSDNYQLSISEEGFSVNFESKNGNRHLKAKINQVRQNQDFQCDINLLQSNNKSMVIVIPFQYQNYFYYNQKINLLQGVGSFTLGKESHIFGDNAFGVLDWGRGVWTYNNTWYWCSINGQYKDHLYGLNLGYGFGDTSNATQNIFYYDNHAYKLGEVVFEIGRNDRGQQDYMQNWRLRSKNNENEIDILFQPMIDRHAHFNYLIIGSNQHQVFGLFSGQLRIGDENFSFETLMGFAQKVTNKW